MCLAVPAQLVACDGQEGVVDLHGNRLRISTVLVPGAAINDWVLVHAGFAIQKLDAAEAAQTFRVLDDLAASRRRTGTGGAT